MAETSSVDCGQKKSPFDDLTRDELIAKCKGLLVIAQKAKLAKTEIQTTVDSYKVQLEKCEAEKKISLENGQTLQELVDSLTEQKLNYITEVDSAQNKVKALTAQCAHFEETINKCSRDLTVRDQTIVDLNKKISDLDIEVISLKRQNNRLLEENEQLLSQLTEYEASAVEFNNIGMQQREQLKILEEKLQTEEHYKSKIEELNKQIKEMEDNVQSSEDYKSKYEEVENLLKETKENEIHGNEAHINQLTNESITLKQQLMKTQQNLDNSIEDNLKLKDELNELTSLYNAIKTQLPAQQDENKLLKEKLNECTQKLNEVMEKYSELEKSMHALKTENRSLNEKILDKHSENDILESLNLQIRALESEKAILVKEKLSARDSGIELESQNKILLEKLNKTEAELQTVKINMDKLVQERNSFESSFIADKEGEINILKSNMRVQQEQFNLLKKEHDDLQDMNNLLKEEVETLKFSLEQPKDDAENLSELNASYQTDIVKLETKLTAYKQENASLLSEIKDARNKSKDYDSLRSEYEDAKSKLASYKTENTELLNEMKEINQVLKERGEAISKLQKAVTEMEKLVETLEKDRDNTNREKVDLLKQIESLEDSLKNAAQKTNEKIDTVNQVNAEMDEALKSLAAKDVTIANLKEEIERFKQHSSGELPNEDMSTSTISKAEEHARMKDLDETFEDKYSKLRLFALKLKKKLNETSAQLHQAEQDKGRLEKLLNEQKSVAIASDVVDGTKVENESTNAAIVSQSKELDSNKISPSSHSEVTENLTIELEKLKAELVLKTQQLAIEVDTHKQTKENLDKALRDVKKKNVLSLEMEDYERSMKELSNKMEDSKKKIIQMESTINTQEGTITAMKTQIKLLEEQIKTEEKQNRLVREELQHAIEEGKDKDSMIQAKNTIIIKLEQDLEDKKRKNEESDLEMTSLLGEKEKIIMALREDKAELNNKVKKVEFKCSELNEKLSIVNIELADLKTEYASYKVRAQAVLRQNQTVDHSQEEQLKEEAAALRSQIETLTSKLVTLQEEVSEKSSEVESARRKVAEAMNEATRAQQRTTRLQADLGRLSQQMDSERTQHKLQVTTLTQCYKTQISELETKLQKETENLKKQLAAAGDSKSAEKVALTSLDTINRNQYMLPVIPKDESSDGEGDINVSMIPREEGEGSESAPSPPLSKSYNLSTSGGGRSPVPLERLLEEGVPEDEPMDASSLGLTPEQEIGDLKRRLQAQQQRVKHVTLLLSESERECARMAQLAELLKGELRRVRGAAHHAHNTEYMKNVTLKFLTLAPGDERSRLVPVLQKILTLSQEETHKIQAIAKGVDPNPSKGWGSYLPWPGGK